VFVGEPLDRVVSTTRTKLLFGAWVLVGLVVTLCLATLLFSLDVSKTEFPSNTGAVLTRARVKIGPSLRLESWYQNSQYSYTLRYAFDQVDDHGNPLSCRLEVAGWYRPESRERSLANSGCVCEQTALHHDRTRDCVNLRFNDNWTVQGE
jgi:hypothetical protein